MRAASGMKKLATLYALMENLRAMEVRTAAFASEQVTQAQDQLICALRAEQQKGRAGLALGSRIESLAGARSAAAAEVLREHLEQANVARAAAHSLAVGEHRESQVELRQMESLLEQVHRRDLAEEKRRAQAESDDGFLARREWLRTKASSGRR